MPCLTYLFEERSSIIAIALDEERKAACGMVIGIMTDSDSMFLAVINHQKNRSHDERAG